MLRCSRFNKTKTFPLLVSWYVVLFMSFQFKDNVLILKLPDKTIMVDNRRVGGGKIAGFCLRSVEFERDPRSPKSTKISTLYIALPKRSTLSVKRRRRARGNKSKKLIRMFYARAHTLRGLCRYNNDARFPVPEMLSQGPAWSFRNIHVVQKWVTGSC